jgi:hypothetical protein
MLLRTPALLVAGLLTAALATAQGPLYTNAELVSIDAAARLVVVRTNDGQTRTMRLADQLVGPKDVRPGDEVILAVRNQPGMPLVSRIQKSVLPTPVRRPLAAPPAPAETVSAPAAEPPALAAFNSRVASLAQQAAYVDALWASFAASCDASVATRYDRDWFALWESGTVRADLSTGFCRDLYNQVIARGESVKAGMSAAEDAARRAALLPGSIRDVRRRYALDWDGWQRSAPERQVP